MENSTFAAAVKRAEAMIVAEEGSYHVRGIYYASEADAATQRRWEAERRVREAERFTRTCAWCNQEIRNGQFSRTIAMEPLHDACADEFDSWWGAVTDDTPVLFDGEPCTWGELAGNERSTCDFNDHGQLEGGYPL